ncbi:transmembrane reductase CYB561D2-like [Anticarsia gemmatalis]|uniref:transmembrane reductase CYB561D2-like n=1 Tax=Anticarsia gemmatalis TaxID=129554 RepID=UPI003F757E1E
MDMNGTENGASKSNGGSTLSSNQYKLKTFLSSLNLLAHVLIGIVVGGSLMFSFRNGLPIGATPIHIVLCVLGYQLLMAEAILSLSPNNGWSLHLRLVDKRRAHWILQIVGSGLAIAGSFIKILDKSVHWNTYHGQFALVALVFTVVSMVNGLTSLWAYELRRSLRLPANLSKLTHICFGIVGFVTAGIALCYGFEKGSFRGWIGDAMAYTLIGFVSCFTFIIIIDPFITFFTKIRSN